MHGANAGLWHSCARWNRYGMLCPFEELDFQDHQEPEDPTRKAPGMALPIGQGPGPSKAKRGWVGEAGRVVVTAGKGAVALAQRAARFEAVAQAEEIVSRDARAIPLKGGESLYDALSGGAVAVGAATAAGAAVQDVLKRFHMRAPTGGGGGYVFQSVMKPKEPLRVR